MDHTEYRAALKELGLSQAKLARMASAAAPHLPPVALSTVGRYAKDPDKPSALPVPPWLCLWLQDMLRLRRAGISLGPPG